MDSTMNAMIFDALSSLVAPAAAGVIAIAALILVYLKLSELFKE